MIGRFESLPVRELGDGLRVAEASTRRARGLGLARLDHLPADQALLIPRCRSVHTMGMRFSLDLLWLDGDGAVVRVDRDVARGRIRTCLRARAVVECAAGHADRFLAGLQ